MARWLRALGAFVLLLAGAATAVVGGPVAPARADGALTTLRSYVLPAPDDTKSGSLAFDGLLLYYAPEPRDARGYVDVHRLDARTGRAAGDIRVPLDSVWHMTYQPHTHHLLVVGRGANDGDFGMWSVDLRDLRVRFQFDVPDGISHYSFDPELRAYRVVPEEADDDGTIHVSTVSPTGSVVDSCRLPTVGGRRIVPSTVVATGDRGFYVQDEDDQTLFRFDDNCRLLASGTHEPFDEAAGENDGMACDTVTFPDTAAVWIRDGAGDKVTAYEVPSGNCPLATSLTPLTLRRARVGEPVDLCTTLSLGGRPEHPLVDRLVAVEAGDRVLATVATDGRGRACVRWTPDRAGAVRVIASFNGDTIHLGSEVVATVTVAGAAPPPPPRQGGGPPPVEPGPPQPQAPQQPAPDPGSGGQPVSNVQPNPGSAPQQNVVPNANPQPVPQVNVQPQPQVQVDPQVQVQAQAQVQAQVQAQPQAALAAQEQVEVATAYERDYRMVRQSQRHPAEPYLPFAAGVVGLIGMAAVAFGRSEPAYARARR